jgi:hypothetical protein
LQLHSTSPVRTPNPADSGRQREDDAAALGRGHNV